MAIRNDEIKFELKNPNDDENMPLIGNKQPVPKNGFFKAVDAVVKTVETVEKGFENSGPVMESASSAVATPLIMNIIATKELGNKYVVHGSFYFGAAMGALHLLVSDLEKKYNPTKDGVQTINNPKLHKLFQATNFIRNGAISAAGEIGFILTTLASIAALFPGNETVKFAACGILAILAGTAKAAMKYNEEEIKKWSKSAGPKSKKALEIFENIIESFKDSTLVAVLASQELVPDFATVAAVGVNGALGGLDMILEGRHESASYGIKWVSRALLDKVSAAAFFVYAMFGMIAAYNKGDIPDLASIVIIIMAAKMLETGINKETEKLNMEFNESLPKNNFLTTVMQMLIASVKDEESKLISDNNNHDDVNYQYDDYDSNSDEEIKMMGL